MDHKFYEGSTVWVKHPVEAWIPATVCSVLQDNMIQVLCPEGNEKTVKILPDTPIPRHVCSDNNLKFETPITEEEYQTYIIDDLTKIPQIITPAVLHLLRIAYLGEQYYCKLGSGTLLALNPFKEVPSLVSTDMVRLYSSSTLKELQNLPAHVYTIAQNAFAAVQSRTGRINQSIIVSGESGAGKTRTVGCMMRFLAEVEETRNGSCQFRNATQQAHINSIKSDGVADSQTTPKILKMTCDSKDVLPTTGESCSATGMHSEEQVYMKSHIIVDNIEKRVLNSNPVLEAFGNAQTIRNNNSSRFGKYIQLQYSRSGFLIGATLKTYLLEKTRVVHHDHGERCYHIFYQMLYGSSEKQRNDWKLLSDPFLEGMKATVDEMYIEHKYNFAKTVNAMMKLGISENMQDRIFKVLSAILHLRQLTFKGPDDLQNPCDIYHDNPELSKCLSIASEHLGVDEQTVKKVITLRRISSHGGDRRKSIFLRPATVRECQIRRDCLLKFIYLILFEWIVRGVQERIRPVNSQDCSFLGLLDIYGFESFENNSLEQLCINFANEKLHHHFSTTFIKNLQEEHGNEGIRDACCDLGMAEGCLLALEAPRVSLFSLLNEECRLNRANAECTLKSRIETVFSENKHIKLPRISSVASSFTVSHFAGPVSYQTEFLIEKNKDEVPIEFIETLAMSKNGFVRQLVSYCQRSTAETENSASAGVKHEHPRHAKPLPTVLMRFKKSLDELLGILSTTDCHYIRCIKPNKQSQPKSFDAQFVLSQMEACGIVDTIRVCSSVYSCRMSYEQFHARYFFLAHGSRSVQQSPHDSPSGEQHTVFMKERCLTILKSVRSNVNCITDEMMQFGKTKVFLSTDLFEHLEFLRSAEIFQQCVVIQSAWRTYSRRKKCRAMRKHEIAERSAAAIVLQNAWRYKFNVRLCRSQRKYIISKMRKSVAVIECAWVSYNVKKTARIYRKNIIRERSAVKIQATFRGWLVRRQYQVHLPARHEQSVFQRLKGRDLDGQNSDLLTGQCYMHEMHPMESNQLHPSHEPDQTKSPSHVPYFELVSNSSTNRPSKRVQPEIRKSCPTNYCNDSGRKLSPTDGFSQGDRCRILLLDHQNVPPTNCHDKTKGGMEVSPQRKYSKAGSTDIKSKDADGPRHVFHFKDLNPGQQSLSMGNSVNPDNIFWNNYNFGITLQWHCHCIAMASAWHRLPSVCVMCYSKSFVSSLSLTNFKTAMWAAQESFSSHSLRSWPVGAQNLLFITTGRRSSVLKYADVQPHE